jgi:hypothetical protein
LFHNLYDPPAPCAPQVYPDLKDHPSLVEYPPVPGVQENVWFMDHTVMEDAVTADGGIQDDMSKANRSVKLDAICDRDGAG